MKRPLPLLLIVSTLALIPHLLAADSKILTNHLGYETHGPKHAVILGKSGDTISACTLNDEATGKPALNIAPKPAGPVQKWRDWYFWTLDFDNFSTEGKYYLE